MTSLRNISKTIRASIDLQELLGTRLRAKNKAFTHQHLILGIVFTFLTITQCIAMTWIVQTEPGGHFVQVQEGIDAATHGDTVLVMPGIYRENLNLHGKNIVLTSRYLFSEDVNDINQTVLDGNQNGRVVNITSGENRNCQIIGFRIQNGYLGPPQETSASSSGAGIKIMYSNPSIISCAIIYNCTKPMGVGAGIDIGIESSPYLSNLSIHNNHAGFNAGGLLVAHSANPEFDEVDKCSIYNNYAGSDNDLNIAISNESSFTIALDTITTVLSEDMIKQWPSNIVVTYEHIFIERLSCDLYVSPTGDDNNSGMSFEEPLKTIQYALTLIESDTLIRRTIFLEEGVYSPSNGQYFPLNIRSNIDLVGAGKNRTILDGENEQAPVLAWFDSAFCMENMTITGCPSLGGNPAALTINECILAEFKNIEFTQNNGGSILQTQGGIPVGYEYLHPLETSSLFDSIKVINNTNRWNTVFGTCKSMIIQNSVIRNTYAGWSDIWESYLNYPMQVRYAFYLNDPKNIIRNVEVTQNDNMEAWGPDNAIAMLVNGTTATVINSTFADNHLPDNMGGGITLSSGAEVLLVNTIVHGNTPNQIWLANGSSLGANSIVVKNCLIEDAEDGVGQSGENTLNWLDGNISGDPWFQGGAEQPYWLAPGSPAIDAGTAFFVWEGDTIIDLSPDEYYGLAPDMGAYEYTGQSKTLDETRPHRFELLGNYPNPFNGSTNIRFSLAAPAEVFVKIVDMQGREVKHIKLGMTEPGSHYFVWTADGLPSGIYLYSLATEFEQLSGKVAFVK